MGLKDKRVDAYIANAAPFARPILAHVRAAVHAASPDVDEAIKWGMPFFCHKGKLLAYMSAFKAHAAFGFYRGALVVGAGTEKREAMGSFGRLTRVSDLPSKRLTHAPSLSAAWQTGPSLAGHELVSNIRITAPHLISLFDSWITSSVGGGPQTTGARTL